MWFHSCCSRGLKLIIIFLHLPSSVSACNICCSIPILWLPSLTFTFLLIGCAFLPQAIPCCFPIMSVPLHQNCPNFPSILDIFPILTYLWLFTYECICFRMDDIYNWNMKNLYISQYMNKQFTNWFISGKQKIQVITKKPCLFLFYFHDENLKPIKMYILLARSEQRKSGLCNFYIQYVMVHSFIEWQRYDYVYTYWNIYLYKCRYILYFI